MTENRRQLILTILVIMVIAIIAVVMYYWFNNTYYVSTDDAKVTGTLVKISPSSTGKLVDLFFDEGDYVEQNQILGRLDVMNLPDQGIEQSLVRAPISGVILKKSCTVGEIISAGQILAYMADPKGFYISANIEETKLKKLHPGQYVTIKVDQYKGKKLTGYVDTIGDAANSVFSLLPSNSGATFTKVVQKIPVHINIDKNNLKLVNGTNAYVKIHIR
jgi:multidrug resistance efflux pump